MLASGWLGEPKVERRREVKLVARGGRWSGQSPVKRWAVQGWRARGRGRRGWRRLVVVSQTAGFGAVGGTVGLLVATQAELVFPVERHDGV